MRDESPAGELQRAATQAAIDYLYRYERSSKSMQLHILARLCEANGCTSAPDFCFGDCCNEHDIAYRTGKTLDGTPVSRRNADAQLMRCMALKARQDKQAAEILAPIYFAAVRVFGESHWIDYVPPEQPTFPTTVD